MLAKNCSISDLEKALSIVNEEFDNNVIFNRQPEQAGKNVRFTLRVKDSKLAGHRRGFSFGSRPAKRLSSACWHVHGKFFDALMLKVNPKAEIITRSGNMFASTNGSYVIHNWEDSNIGSVYNPLYFSEACDCKE